VLTFDPAIEMQKLRDHFASHNKPLVFLFGAGTSMVPGADRRPLIPAVAELTERCKKAVTAEGRQYAEAWVKIADVRADRTIEDILSAVRQMREVALDGDKLGGLDKPELETLETVIQKAISLEVRPAETRIPPELPHASLARWILRIDRSSPVEIFTTNYDTLLERALEGQGVPVFDGFVGAHRPFFSPASLMRDQMAPGRRWTRLWKLHGSVTWLPPSRDGDRIVRGEEQQSGEMILPSLLKYDESRKQPYVAMMDRFRRALAEREDAVLVTAGYSFGDQHINEVIFEALDANPRLHVFALCFDNPPVGGELHREALKRMNILVLGPHQAIVRGEVGTWSLPDTGVLDARLVGIFDPAGASGTPPGHLKLGDFSVLCALLAQIAGDDGRSAAA